jgi:hypothetical protein
MNTKAPAAIQAAGAFFIAGKILNIKSSRLEAAPTGRSLPHLKTLIQPESRLNHWSAGLAQ